MPDYINPDTIDPNRSYAQQLLEQQGYTSPSSSVTPQGMGAGQPDLMALFSQLMGILGPQRGTDPLSNLEPFKVSPTRGFFSYPMGGQAGSLPTIPATFMMDTINNTPGNLPGAAGGKYAPSQLALQENDVYTVNSMMPFSEPVFGNKLLQPTPFHRMRRGGKPKTFFGKLLKGVKDTVGGIGDLTLSALGAPDVFQNTFVDRSKPLSAITGTLGKIAPMALNAVIPGAGTGLKFLGSGLNSIGQAQTSQQGTYGDLSGLGYGQFPSQGYSSGSMLSPLMGFGNFNPIQNITSGLGQFGATPGIAGQMPGMNFGGLDLGALLSGFQGMNVPQFGKGDKVGNKIRKLKKEHPNMKHDQLVAIALSMLEKGKYQYGGFSKFPLGGQPQEQPELVPIQTEEGEIIVHPNLLITQVNARKKHKSMDDDEVTDILSSDSYILSNDPKMRISKESTEDIIMGIKSQPYSEDEQAMEPETIEFEEIFGNNKKMTPAELGLAIRNKFPIINKTRNFEFSDVFTEETNKRNLESRSPYLEVLMALNEFKKMGKDSPFKFKHGGPVKMRHLNKYPEGGDVLSQIFNIAGTALPFLSGLFNKNNQPGQQYINAALPIDQAAFQSNVNARDNAYGQAIQDFSGLGQNLNQLALGTAGAGIMGNLLQETNLPRFDYNSARARLNNFNTNTPRAFAEALSRPTYDTRAILQELGPRAGTALVGLDANRVNSRNTAMINQFNQDRNLGFNVLQGLNNIDIGEQQANIPLQLQEIQARNAQRSGVFNQFGDLFNRLGQIQSSLLPITTGFNLERANLVGQPGMRAAQNLLNAGQLQAAYSGGQGQTQPGALSGINWGDLISKIFGGGQSNATGGTNTIGINYDSYASGCPPGLCPQAGGICGPC